MTRSDLTPAGRVLRPRTKRARDKHDARRQQIVDAAVRLFNEKPYESVSIRDLEAESGLTRGPIYYYFRNKEEIYGEVIKEGLGRMLTRIGHAIAAHTTPRTQLLAIIDTYLDEYEEARNTFDVLARFFFGMRPTVSFPPSFLNEVSVLLRGCIDLTIGVIAAGAKAGVFRCRDPEFEVMTMWGMMTTVVQMTDDNARMRAVGRNREALHKDLRTHILASLGAKP